MAKIVVTGGAGFIGSHITDALVVRGDHVVVVDNFSTGSRKNLEHLEGKIELIEGDITDIDFLKEVFKGADAIIHQAAVPSVPKSVEHPLETNYANSVGTLSVFIAAKQALVDRVIYASSSSYYGDTAVLPKVETMSPNPLSPYAIQKLTGEMYGKVFFSLYGLKTIGLRYFNIFGPRQDPHSEYSAVIPKFVTLIKDNKNPVIYGDGETTRDFTYVQNAVHANLLALEAEDGFGEVCNIAAGNRISLNDLVKKINEILGKNIQPEYQSMRKGDIKDSYADIEKAKSILGYEVIVPFEKGLDLTIESFK